MSRLTCLLATAGAMLLSSGAHAGEIWQLSSVNAIEHEIDEYGYNTNTTLSVVHVGYTQIDTIVVQSIMERCRTQLYTMLDQPGEYTLRLDIDWVHDSQGNPVYQYIRSCKLQRLP